MPLAQALGRVLAKPVKAVRDQPPFDASAMDGYAVLAADVANMPADADSSSAPLPRATASRARCKRGQCVRIFTGAPMPKGADAVVIQENVEARGQGRSAFSRP